MTVTSWRALFEAAMLELDPEKLGNSIDAAYASVEQRIQALTMGGTTTHENAAEMQALADAQQSLRNLQRLERGNSFTQDCTKGEILQGKAS